MTLFNNSLTFYQILQVKLIYPSGNLNLLPCISKTDVYMLLNITVACNLSTGLVTLVTTINNFVRLCVVIIFYWLNSQSLLYVTHNRA